MAALRPDVAYSILDLYTLKQDDPARPGAALREVLSRIATGEIAPLMHTRWPLAETSAAMGFMRAARHIGKIVLTLPPLRAGRLSQDGTYLVTGGMGRYRLRARRMACRARCGSGRSEWPQAAGSSGGESDRGAASPRI